MRGLLTRPLRAAARATAGRSRWQWLWRRLHAEALVGRHFGEGDFLRSGELAALQRVRRSRPQAAVVLDVGANHGGWALEARQMWPGAAVHAFEPATETFDRLLEATQDAGITCVRAACGAENGVAELHSVPGLPGLSSLHDRDLTGVNLTMTEIEEVPVTTLATYCAQQGITEIDMLKVDAEGHDLAVLLGAGPLITEGRVAAVQFEFGGTNIDARTFLRDFVRLLSPHYRIYRLLLDGLEELHYSEREEIFVATNYLALRADLVD
jgi:FkbM family methyltransferase